jgi:hypothetical protein
MTSFEHWLLEAHIAYQISAVNGISGQIQQTDYIVENQIYIQFFSYSSITNNIHSSVVEVPTMYPVKIWEDQWMGHSEIIKSRILNKLGRVKTIAAKLTHFKKINQTEADEFLNQNHLLGTTKAKYKYGLYYGSVLISVATFTWPRKFYVENKSPLLSYSLIRHCTLNYLNIQGGLSKMVANFAKERKPDDILTITDLDWSEGESYKNLGFELLDKTPAETYYIDTQNHQRYNAKIFTNELEINSSFIKIQNSGNCVYKLYFNE